VERGCIRRPSRPAKPGRDPRPLDPPQGAGRGASGRLTASGHPNGRIKPHPGQCFGTPLCRRKITMRASARLLFAIAFIGGMHNAALAGSRASLADLLGQGYEVKATSTRHRQLERTPGRREAIFLRGGVRQWRPSWRSRAKPQRLARATNGGSRQGRIWDKGCGRDSRLDREPTETVVPAGPI
jgi:hypothetical protein